MRTRGFEKVSVLEFKKRAGQLSLSPERLYNDNNKYTIKDITYKNFIELYKNCECKDSRCSACITALKAGRCSTIPMKYLIYYSKRFGKTIDFLLKG